MKLPVHNLKGEEVDTIEADDLVFGLSPHRAVLRQALLAQLANRRAGSANTKTRGEVRGSTIKIRPQKGRGVARQGSIRAPHRRHGGIVFGPQQRSYRQDLPRRMRRLAIRSAISSKVQDGSLRIVTALGFEEPRTRAVADVLQALDIERSALLVTDAPDRNLFLSARNLTGAKALPAPYLNVADLMSHRCLVLTVDAVRRVEALWGGDRVNQRRSPSMGGGRE